MGRRRQCRLHAGTGRPRGILERLTRLSDAVPLGVSRGYHFCYGDSDASQVEKPLSPAAMIDLYHGLANRLQRTIDRVHMTVGTHVDTVFVDCFKAMRRRSETQLYLGLHSTVADRESEKRRFEMAAKFCRRSALRPGAGLLVDDRSKR